MKINIKELYSIIEEEATKELYSEVEPEGTSRQSFDSADDQIDSFLIKFEKDSILDEEDQSLLESLQGLKLTALLEQEEDEDVEADIDIPEEEEDEDEEAEENEEDQKVSDPAGSEDQTADQPADPPKLPLDVDSFTKKVARLAINANILLQIDQVVVNRALNYLKSNYDEAHAKKMLEILDEQFDFNRDDPGNPVEDHYAVGAYAGGAGGGGGV